MNRDAIAVLAAVVLFPSASLAQTAPRPPVRTDPPTYLGGSTDPSPASYASNYDFFGDEIRRRNLDERTRLTLQNTSPARMERAERVAELINAGDCAGAQALALQENDRRLARRVGDVCEAEN